MEVLTYESTVRPRRRETPRRDARPKSGYVSGFVIGALATLLAIALSLIAWRWRAEQEAKNAPVKIGRTMDSLTVSYDYRGEATRWYVVVDPEYGIQYLYNDRGGVCQRIMEKDSADE